MTSADPVVFYAFLIFTGAALLATLALYARQSLLVVYIALGALLGPSAAGVFTDPQLIKEIAHIGVILLLFLLGINLPPQKLLRMLRETTLVAGASSLIFLLFGAAGALAFGFTPGEALVIGAALTFSSTIIGLKLLPTTVLHHQHTGELIISILLMQDIIAILVLILLPGGGAGQPVLAEIVRLFLALFGLMGFAYGFERFVLIRLIRRFDRIREYIFLMAIGWCLGLAVLAAAVGLSAEIGAFIAGVVLATSPISLFIAESLKPLRDFFLVLFFFALGAGFDLAIIGEILLPALALAAAVLVIKPYVFKFLLHRYGEAAATALEVGIRLGQTSEFSLFIAVAALDLGVIGAPASYLIQVGTLFTFLVSSYIVVLRYPSPIAVSDRLRRD